MSGRRVVMDGEDGASGGSESKASRPLTLNERFSNLPKPPRQDVKTNFAVNLGAAVKEQRQVNKQAAQKQQRQNVVTKRRIAATPSLPATQNLREAVSRPNTRSRGGLATRGTGAARGGRGRGAGRAPVSITSTRGAFRGRGRGRGAVSASVPAGRGRGRGAIAKGGRAAAPAPVSNGVPRGRGRGRGAVAAGRGRGGARGRGRGGRGGASSGSGGAGAIDKDALDAEMDLYMGKDPNIEKLNQELDAYSAQRTAKDHNADK